MKAKGFCLLLLLLLLPCIGMAETHTVENEGYVLTIDGETMALTMLDKASGKLYASGADPDSVSGNAAWKGFLSSSFSIDYVFGTSTSACVRVKRSLLWKSWRTARISRWIFLPSVKK